MEWDRKCPSGFTGKNPVITLGRKIGATKIIRTIIAAAEENCTNGFSAFLEKLLPDGGIRQAVPDSSLERD